MLGIRKAERISKWDGTVTVRGANLGPVWYRTWASPIIPTGHTQVLPHGWKRGNDGSRGLCLNVKTKARTGGIRDTVLHMWFYKKFRFLQFKYISIHFDKLIRFL